MHFKPDMVNRIILRGKTNCEKPNLADFSSFSLPRSEVQMYLSSFSVHKIQSFPSGIKFHIQTEALF